VPVGIADVRAPAGSNVFVDDSFMGVAPIGVTAPMGMHKVKIESASNKGSFRTVDVVFGEAPVEVDVDDVDDAEAAPASAAPAAPARASWRAHAATPHVTRRATSARAHGSRSSASAKGGSKSSAASEMEQARELQAQAAAATANSL
jgi:hypothetical protein